jgi:quinol monooxygenase YgiN/type IV secretory pathway VirB2 component (pilin)
MSSAYLIIAGGGAVAAAVGSGVLLARTFRGPRIDLAACSVALIGLLISLGAQALGYLDGFDSAMFRAMELGAQVIAPLALVLALSEVAGRSLAVRFCARVYIPAVAIVAFVVLSLDQLASTAFTKAWPDPAVFYETPPRWVLMFAIGPITALIAVVAIVTVGRRVDKRGWDAVLPAQVAGGGAALLLAYPALAMLANYKGVTDLPGQHSFTVLCAAATVAIWFAGVHFGRIRIALLQGRGAAGAAVGSGAGWEGGDQQWESEGGRVRDDGIGPPGRGRDDLIGPPARGTGRVPDGARWDDARGQPEVDQTGDIDQYMPGGPYRRADAAGGQADYGWQTRDDRYAGRDRPGPEHDYPEEGVVATGDLDLGAGGTDWDRPAAEVAAQGYQEELAGGRHRGDWQDDAGQPDRGQLDHSRLSRGDTGDRAGFGGDLGADRSRADLFGQIAIYTLLEDRVHEFDQLTERVVEKVRASESDTLVFIVHAVPSAPMQRILYEVYRDRDAYERHRQQPYVLKFEADRRPYVLATNVIELGLQQAKVSPFPSVSELFGEPGYDTSGFERPDYLRDYGRPAGQSGASW